MNLAAVTIALVFGICPGGSDGCYSYESGVVTLDPQRVTPYVLTHEVGHVVYFRQMSDAERRAVAVGDPDVRDEEAFADVYAACVLGLGPRWLARNGYGVRIGPHRFRRICRAARAAP